MVKIGGADYSTFTDGQEDFFIFSGSSHVDGGENHQVEKEVLLENHVS